MRLLRFILPFLIVGLVACSNDGGKIRVKDEKNGTAATIDINSLKDIAKATESSGDKAEELKKLTPLSPDQLKALMPEEFMGMKRTDFSANSFSGASSCNATYAGDDGKTIKFQVFDCAGEAGAGIYTLRYWSLWNFQHEDENGYQKTVDFKGQNAIEKYNKSSDEYSITFMSGDRLLVTVEGEKTGLDVVKQAANNLNLDIK